MAWQPRRPGQPFPAPDRSLQWLRGHFGNQICPPTPPPTPSLEQRNQGSTTICKNRVKLQAEAPKAAAPAPEKELVAAVSESKPGPVVSTTTAAPPQPPPPPPPAAAAPQKRTDGRVIATPYAKKLAKELGLDLNQLVGSGPAGRITAQDVEGFKSNRGQCLT